MRQDVRELTLVSPRSPELSRLARSPLRVWYLTALDEHVRGAPGRYVLDASVDRVDRAADGSYAVRLLDAAGAEYVVEADEVIAATGFSTPLGDLPARRADDGRGRAAPGADRALRGDRPARAPTSPATRRTRRAGRPGAARSTSPAWSAATATTRASWRGTWPSSCAAAPSSGRSWRPRPSSRSSCRSWPTGPSSRCRRATSPASSAATRARALRDDGILPLEVFLDGAEDGLAVTLELDGEERIRPVVYLRRRGELREEALPSHPLRRFDEPSYRAELAAFIAAAHGVTSSSRRTVRALPRRRRGLSRALCERNSGYALRRSATETRRSRIASASAPRSSARGSSERLPSPKTRSKSGVVR